MEEEDEPLSPQVCQSNSKSWELAFLHLTMGVQLTQPKVDLLTAILQVGTGSVASKIHNVQTPRVKAREQT